MKPSFAFLASLACVTVAALVFGCSEDTSGELETSTATDHAPNEPSPRDAVRKSGPDLGQRAPVEPTLRALDRRALYRLPQDASAPIDSDPAIDLGPPKLDDR